MITVLIQHRLRCEVAPLSFSAIYSTVFAFGSVPAQQHTSPRLLSSIHTRWQAANNESPNKAQHIFFCRQCFLFMPFLFLCGLTIALSITMQSWVPPLVLILLSLTLLVQSKKRLQRLQVEMISGFSFSSFLVAWALPVNPDLDLCPDGAHRDGASF